MPIEITTAREHELQAVLDLLAAAGLPTGDLTAEHLADFLVAREADGASVAGFVGLEHYDDVGLLRSLLVAPAARGGGLGRRLVDALEARARSRGIVELWLLTIDADAYFETLEYRTAARADAPAAIRGTREFAGLCPDDAVLMRKSL